MKPSEDIESVTALKRDAAQMIARARRRASPIVITQNGRATAVLQDVESYERQRRALLLLKLVAEGERDIEAGRVLSDREMALRIAARLDSFDERSG